MFAEMLWAGPPSRCVRGASTPNFELRDTNKGWAREWFVVSNPAPCLPARTGHAPECKACWEEPPTAEEMAQVERLLEEIAGLSAHGLTRAAVAISFCRWLTQPIQERVHPAFEYWGHRDPTRGHERKVPRDEIANRVARIMAGQIRDKGFPKAHCPKRPTDTVSLLEPCRVVLIRSRLFPSALVGMYNNSALLQAKVLEYWSSAPLPEGDPGKNATTPTELL